MGFFSYHPSYVHNIITIFTGVLYAYDLMSEQ